ncbi:MAG: LytTR family DNA-binding domain-containing protein, partial [Bacteroidota bacterium]
SYDLVKVSKQDILFIQADADYTEVVTAKKKYLTSDPLREWKQKLSDGFSQVHKSYIINRGHLVKVSQNKAHLSDGTIVPIGRAYKKGFMEKVQ